MTSKTIIDGHAVTYDSTGRGKTVLLLHGWQSNHRAFQKLIDALRGSYRLVAPDLPGFGGSEVPREAWDVERYAEFCKRFCQKQDVSPYAIVGHSLGGRITIKATAQELLHPQRIILLGSAGVKDASLRTAALGAGAKLGKAVTSVPGLRRAQQTLRKKLYGRIGATDYLTAGPLKETFKNIIDEDLLPDATRITVPALLIWGAEDTETPVSQGERLAHAISDSRLEVIPNAGHYVQLDAPRPTGQLIKEFLA